MIRGINHIWLCLFSFIQAKFKGSENNSKNKNQSRVVMGRGTRTIEREKSGSELLGEGVREQLKEKIWDPSCYEKSYQNN